jgi:ABC-type dipeptide/oligopeptide/nickel transport system permease component
MRKTSIAFVYVLFCLAATCLGGAAIREYYVELRNTFQFDYTYWLWPNVFYSAMGLLFGGVRFILEYRRGDRLLIVFRYAILSLPLLYLAMYLYVYYGGLPRFFWLPSQSVSNWVIENGALFSVLFGVTLSFTFMIERESDDGSESHNS